MRFSASPKNSNNGIASPIWLILLATMTALGPVSIDLYLPAFDWMERDLGQGVEDTLAAYLFGVAIGQLIYGPVSDRFGRKPPLYVALALYVAGSVACAFSDSMTQLIVWRFVQALGGCAGVVIARAMVRDRCQPQEAARAFSTLMMITAIAPIVAPACGGLIVRLTDWRVAFWIQAVIGAVLLLAVHFILEETRDTRSAPPLSLQRVLATYRGLLKDRRFMGYALMGGFSIGTIFCYVSGAPTVLIGGFGLSPQYFGWLMGLNGLCFVIGSQLNLRRLRNYTPGAVLRVAVWAPLLLSLALAVLSDRYHASLAGLLALQLSVFIAMGHIAPNIAAEALAERGENAGTASALLGSLQSVGSTLAGVAMGVANNGTMHHIAVLMSMGSVLLVLSHVLLVSTRPPSSA